MKSIEVNFRVTKNGTSEDIQKELWIEVDPNETDTDLITNEIEIALIDYYEAIASEGEEIVITTNDNMLNITGKRRGKLTTQLPELI